ncbi:carotenoid biosynthesis protein [Alteribacillus sp. HJP-4]|uniref:carotenoid biosynthesis protein n=1 Tax=Alteribacillus sp. HJP-4 TaxID=2775394 RepID=UPI0035CD250E
MIAVHFDTWVYRLFLIWYICGIILLSFQLIPPALEWSNSVFLILAGLLGMLYFIRSYGTGRGMLLSLYIFLFTMTAEGFGVAYGVFFGDYFYNSDFGMMVQGVPITIGFAWLMVTATTHVLAKRILIFINRSHMLGAGGLSGQLLQRQSARLFLLKSLQKGRCLMKKAAKQPAFEWMFHQYNRAILKKHFHRISFRFHPPAVPAPAVFFVNHSSWWDPLIIHYANRELLLHDSFAMMDETGLSSYPFFQKLGAFSVYKKKSKEVLLSLRYASSLLDNDKSIWLFPQGEEKHAERRPLEFMGGLAYLAKKHPEVLFIPVSVYYSFIHEQKPQVFLEIGRSCQKKDFQTLNRHKITSQFEKILTEQLDQLRSAVIHEELSRFSLLVKGNTPLSEGYRNSFLK